MSPKLEFAKVIREAIAFFQQHGYTSQSDLDTWSARIEAAAKNAMLPPKQSAQQLAEYLSSIYQRNTRKIPQRLRALQQQFAKAQRMSPRMFFAPYVSEPQLQAKMRKELDARVLQSVGLIKLRQEAAVNGTLRRFKGWVSSLPMQAQMTQGYGGEPYATIPIHRRPKNSEAANDLKESLAKTVRQVKFEKNRLNTDQGHKLNAALNAVLAENTGAIAVVWHSHWRQNPTREKGGYQWRRDHKNRDGQVYAIEGNWALKAGLMKAVPRPDCPSGYYQALEAEGEGFSQPVFCRCYGQYIYNIDALPPDMLTAKGKKTLADVEKEMAL
jgi:hypothetical protein